MSLKECIFCFNNQQNNFINSSLNSPVPKQRENIMYNIVKKNLERKYLTSREYYNEKVITDIIYNESTNLVSVFKDYLILDDVSEFLKRFYTK